LIGTVVCAADAAAKVLAVADLTSRRPVVLLDGLLTLRLYRNPGAAFSVGPSYTAVYALIAVGVLVGIIRVCGRLRSWPWAIALGLLLGGAAGNLLDRLLRSPGPLHGFVVDWIKLAYFRPVFNVADSAITAGAAVLVLAGARGWRLDGGSSPSSEDAARAGRPPAGVSLTAGARTVCACSFRVMTQCRRVHLNAAISQNGGPPRLRAGSTAGRRAAKCATGPPFRPHGQGRPVNDPDDGPSSWP
jgi:signal peptidase II